MGMGPITIFDKSALQSLSMDESVWLDAFFLVNIVPLFYVETLADLEKEVAEGSPQRILSACWQRRRRQPLPLTRTTTR
jgi:hypothetical protein